MVLFLKDFLFDSKYEMPNSSQLQRQVFKCEKWDLTQKAQIQSVRWSEPALKRLSGAGLCHQHLLLWLLSLGISKGASLIPFHTPYTTMHISQASGASFESNGRHCSCWCFQPCLLSGKAFIHPGRQLYGEVYQTGGSSILKLKSCAICRHLKVRSLWEC